MPQITNRKLVVEMGATPSGPGTVYSAMLKACSTNRERAARVNDSERQRLQKATGVIDKHSRHNQWMCDQEIEKVRKSLARLDAYQKVLREEYPVKNLIGQKNYRGNHPPIKRKTAQSLLKSRAHSNAASSSCGGTSILASSSNADEKSTRLLHMNNTVSVDKSQFETFKDISIESKDENRNQDQNTAFRNEQVSFTNKGDNTHTERNSPDIIDIVTSANSPIPPNRINNNKLKVQIVKESYIFLPTAKNENDDRDEKITMPTLCDTLAKNQLAIKIQNPEKNAVSGVNDSSDNIINNNSNNNDNDYDTNNKTFKSKPTRIPNTWMQAAYDKSELNPEVPSPESKPLSPNTDALAVPEVTTHEQKRKERIQRLQAKWRAMMEDRVCNRGFGMNTLRVDIDRKIRRMNTDRRHREIKKSLLEESMTANHRIIRVSKETFDKIITDASPRGRAS